MPLTDALARAAKPRDGKLTKFSDGAGLQLWAHPNGARSSFSTMANKSGLWAFDAIERALAHQDGSEVRRAYHRADYFEERRRLMQWMQFSQIA